MTSAICADEIRRQLSELTEDQEDELDMEIHEDSEKYYWTSAKRLWWMWREAISRGWIQDTK